MKVFFYCFTGKSEGDGYGEVWMYPPPRVRNGLPVEEIEELPPRLASDYRMAMESYEAGHWRAAASQARIILEGIVKTLLPHDSQADGKGQPLNLYALTSRLAESRDLAQPIKDVGQVLREGGNLASHFDKDWGISAELASEVLDLLDAFINYLMFIPLRVDSLKKEIAGE